MRTRTLAMAGMVIAAVATVPAKAQAGVHVSGRVVITSRDDRGPRGDWRGTGPAYRYGYDRGWRDGSDEGSRDGRRNRDPRFWREDEFRDGDRGYKHWMGPRFDYTQGYREGYRMAYRRAYAACRPGWGGRDGRGRDDGYYRGDGRYDERGRYDDRWRYDERNRYERGRYEDER